MNLRSLFLCGPVVTGALLAPIDASAARLPTSTIEVNILSVDRESEDRQEISYPNQPSVIFDTSKFVAKAKIVNVVRTDQGLTAGSIIDIHYDVTLRMPPVAAFRVRPSLTPGESVTITVFGGAGSFVWRR